MQVVLGTLLASLVPVVGFNAVMTSEHFASFLVSFFFQHTSLPSMFLIIVFIYFFNFFLKICIHIFAFNSEMFPELSANSYLEHQWFFILSFHIKLSNISNALWMFMRGRYSPCWTRPITHATIANHYSKHDIWTGALLALNLYFGFMHLNHSWYLGLKALLLEGKRQNV